MATRNVKLKVILDPIYNGSFERATAGSAAYDLRCLQDPVVGAGQRAIVGTGVYVAFPPGYYGLLELRSSVRRKGLTMGGVGIIDNDYRGELQVILFNPNTYDIFLDSGSRIAQLLLQKVCPAEVEVVERFQETTVRGDGGFGSTGSN